jgi:predicted MFS family arabinose efflux permease
LSSGDRTVRWLVVTIGAIVFLDRMFCAVISPLLPQLSHQLGLWKLSAGVMTASYPAGVLLASIPDGVGSDSGIRSVGLTVLGGAPPAAYSSYQT